MRDLALLTVLFAAAPVALFSPYFGVLAWNFLSFFNPHRYTWGVGQTFPVAQLIAIPTLAGCVFSIGSMNRRVFARETVLVLTFGAWCAFVMFYATFVPGFSGHIADGMQRLATLGKILLMTMCTVLVVNSKERFRTFMLVIAGSLGIHAIRGFLFGIRTAGQSRVWGPPDTFIADNNDFALALNMVMPMLFYMGWHEERRWLRWSCRFAFLASMVSVILTYSRGGLLGLTVVLLSIAMKSKRKVIAGFVIAIAALLVLTFASQQWMERMGNFAQGKLDRSAEQRLFTWQFAINLAKAYPVTGGGFEVFTDGDVKIKHAPQPVPDYLVNTGPHSIYFQVLGEQGYVGLALFLALLGSCFFSLSNLRRKAKRNPALEWAVPYCNMLQVGLLAYSVSGAFLGRAYFDLYFTLVAGVIVLKVLSRRELASAAASDVLAEVPLEGEVQPV